MTLYYTLVFVLLVVEMVAFFVLVTPLPFNFRRKLFHFISTSELISKTQYTLKIIFVFILILFIDSVNRVYRVQADFKSNTDVTKLIQASDGRADIQARKFYAQRNMYLCGFTLFLSIILNRTYATVADLLAAQDKIALLTRDSAEVDRVSADSDSKVAEIASLREQLRQKDADFSALKSQAEGLSKEYNRLGDVVNAKDAVSNEAAKDK
ncbi:B-cell receptor-associated protein 31-like-domain-containing protein [Lipomyces oligophaga]|uniref:B-cell receptor-associated protein 31-like-domain-containing protein n=1 Tax=Lipomyces oligophaga TaxID=45792 RepID=UPI0034CFFE17